MDKSYSILVINPGSTSTKIAAFKNEKMIFESNIHHQPDKLASFSRTVEQYELRRDNILEALNNHNINVDELDAVVGRGGLLKPLNSGTYSVNDTMMDELRRPGAIDHASNLGVLIANEIAQNTNSSAFTVDPVTVDELEPVARISGLADISRQSRSHALNTKAMSRKAADEMGTSYQNINLVCAHIGGGISVTAHRKGQMIDVVGGVDGGPFSPERAGELPLTDVIDLCFSGLAKDEVKKKLGGKGGLVSYLGTNNAIEVGKRIQKGDAKALLITEAMAYQIAKSIGSMATVLKGDVDTVLLTGGCAYWDTLTDLIKERVNSIAPVRIFPGEHEMIALAQGALRVLRGEEKAKEYHSA